MQARTLALQSKSSHYDFQIRPPPDFLSATLRNLCASVVKLLRNKSNTEARDRAETLSPLFQTASSAGLMGYLFHEHAQARDLLVLVHHHAKHNRLRGKFDQVTMHQIETLSDSLQRLKAL